MEHSKNVMQQGQAEGATHTLLSLTLLGNSHLSPSCLTQPQVPWIEAKPAPRVRSEAWVAGAVALTEAGNPAGPTLLGGRSRPRGVFPVAAPGTLGVPPCCSCSTGHYRVL